MLASTPAQLERFSHAYRTHRGLVRSTARRLVPDAGCWDDVVQEVWLTAARKLDAERDPLSAGWLVSTTHNIAARFRRDHEKQQRRARGWHATRNTAARDDLRLEARGDLQRVLAALPPEQRRAWEQHSLGVPGPAIAAQERINLHTLYSRLRLAKAALRRRVEDERRQIRAGGWAPFSLGHWTPFATSMFGLALALQIHTPTSTRLGKTAGERPPIEAASTPATPPVLLATSPPTAIKPVPLSGSTPATEHLQTHHPQPFARNPNPRRATATPHAPRKAEHRTPRRSARQPTLAAIGGPQAGPQGRPQASPAATGLAESTQPAELASSHQLLQQALLSLRAGKPEAARQACRRHAHRYPNSELARFRDAILVRALCRLGRVEQARILAHRSHAAIRAFEECARSR